MNEIIHVRVKATLIKNIFLNNSGHKIFILLMNLLFKLIRS